MERSPQLLTALAVALMVLGSYTARCDDARGRVTLVRSEVPHAAYRGEGFDMTVELRTIEPLQEGCHLFIHVVGKGKGSYINADIAQDLSRDLRLPHRNIRVGPVRVYVPYDVPRGAYDVVAGLFYTAPGPLGAMYKKVPYTNPEARDWKIATIKVQDRPRVSLPEKGKDGFRIGFQTSLEKIFSEKELLPEGLLGTIAISQAKNEYEGFQLIVIPFGAGVEDVTAQFGDLIHEDGAHTIDKRFIQCRAVKYVLTKKPYYNTPKVGLWPDPLIAFQSFDVKKENVQPLWVTIYVPADACPGNYKGTVRVTAKGHPVQDARFSVKVWDFSLPDRPSLRTGFDFYEYLVGVRHPARKGETDESYRSRLEDLTRAYYMDMLQHRIAPIHNVGNPKFAGTIDGRYKLDFSEFDERVEWYRAKGQTSFGIAQEWPRGGEGGWTDAWYGYTDREALEGVFREYGIHLEEKGWLSSAYAYIFDETFQRVEEVTRLIHKAHPGIKNLLTATPQDGYPDVDIWCVRINNLERETTSEFRKKGKTLWMYVAGHTRPYPGLNLDVPAIEHRLIPWICFKYKIEGLLYWCVNYWHETNPWEDPMTFPEQNGNGSLYYPDPEGKSPVGSIRLEVLRDGIEDFEYLSSLREALDERATHPAGDDGFIRELQQSRDACDGAVGTPAYYTHDPKEIYRLREEVGSLIERALRSKARGSAIP